jgi:putative transcriptional regulator
MAVLEKKREVTRFQILVEVAAGQPQVKQSHVADRLGITPQAVSEYIKDLVTDGMITSSGRGQYSVTPTGVETIIEGAKELKDYSEHVLKNVVGQVSVWAALAQDDIRKDASVCLVMKDGILYASARNDVGACGVAVNDAHAGEDVGVTGLKGVIPLKRETVRVIRVPVIISGGSRAVNIKKLRDSLEGIVAASGIEALAALKAADIEPDIFFGASGVIVDAAIRGVKGTLVVSEDVAPDAIQRLEAADIEYKVIDVRTR